MKRRVVITGLGAVTPIGNTVPEFWESVKTGKVGIGEITKMDVADFDVLKNDKGEYLIIEMNPRVPASLRAAAVSGVNFPELIVNGCLGLPKRRYDYTPGKKLRYLGLDIMWFINSDKRFSCKPSWFNFFGKDLYYQEGGIKDFKAMCFSLLEG